MAALRTAPSAAERIAGELEKIASERKSLERRAMAKEQSNGHQGVVQLILLQSGASAKR